jgi:hypothetical protein
MFIVVHLLLQALFCSLQEELLSSRAAQQVKTYFHKCRSVGSVALKLVLIVVHLLLQALVCSLQEELLSSRAANSSLPQ